MNPPFQCWQDQAGNLWVAAGRVVAINSGATVTFRTNTAIAGGTESPGAYNPTNAAAASLSMLLTGGSGRNYVIRNGPSNPLFPQDYFRPFEPLKWDSPEFEDAAVNMDGVTGDLALNDGVDDVATGAAVGVWTSTVSAGTFPQQAYAFASKVGTLYKLRGVIDPSKYVLWDTATGDADLYDENGEVATKTGASTANPNGSYPASTDGENDYNGGNPWTFTLSGGSNTGTLSSTAYGEATYNAGNPFTADITFEGDPPGQGVTMGFDSGTAQEDLYAWDGWQQWTSTIDPAWIYTIDGSGLGELSDGTDIVATRPADPDKLYDPSGPLISTAYGQATYGAATSTISGSPSAGAVDAQDFALSSDVAGIETYPGTTNPNQFINLDTATGDAVLYDESGLAVAERLAGSTSTPDGSYSSTPYGEDTHNGGSPFTFTVATAAGALPFGGSAILQPKPTLAGYVYVVLEIDGSNEATGILGPFFATSMPANTSTEKSIPIAYSDGINPPEQIQIGSITWVA